MCERDARNVRENNKNGTALYQRMCGGREDVSTTVAEGDAQSNSRDCW